MRRSGRGLPVVVITARDSLDDRISGLDSGADDYLVKPFDLDELLARVRAVLRRRGGRGTPEIAYGALTLDPARRRVTFRGAEVELSAREFSVLEALLKEPGTVVRARSSRMRCTAGARRSAATPSRCTCTTCAASSSPA